MAVNPNSVGLCLGSRKNGKLYTKKRVRRTEIGKPRQKKGWGEMKLGGTGKKLPRKPILFIVPKQKRWEEKRNVVE